MRTYTLIIACTLLSLSLSGCHGSPQALLASNRSSSQAADKQNPSSGAYHIASVAVWEIDQKGSNRSTRMEATVETLNAPLTDATDDLPISRLRIRNLTANKTIFEEDVDDFFISMYTREINRDRELHPELVLTFEGGATSERLLILSVNAIGARLVLDESYRVDASIINLGRDALDVLITTAESGAGPAYTIDYVWKGDRYQPAGRVSHESLTRVIKKQFNTTPLPHKTRPR